MTERIDATKMVLGLAQEFLKTVPDPKPHGWLIALDVVAETIKEAEAASTSPAGKAKIAASVLQLFSIEAIMVLSTSHVHESTMLGLTADTFGPINVRAFGNEGVIVNIPPDQNCWNDLRDQYGGGEIPEDLWVCMEHARAHGCVWLLLDADAITEDALPSYEW